MDRKYLVYKGSSPNHCCCDQALCILPNGRMVVAFMTGGDKEPELDNHLRCCWSDDRGKTWSQPIVILRYPDRACCMTQMYLDMNGHLVIFAQPHDGGFTRWECVTIKSEDGGETWSAPSLFEPSPRRCFIRNVITTSWGEWIMPLQTYVNAGKWENSAIDDNSLSQPENGVLISQDRGQTWFCSNLFKGANGWAENNIVELSNGKLVMLIRSDNAGVLLRSESTDRGRNWIKPVQTDIPNPGSKFRLFKLSDGRIILLHNPNGKTSHANDLPGVQLTRNPLAMWISSDDMDSWYEKRNLTDFPGMLAYPDGVVDEQEQYIHFVFDYNRHDVIYWAAAIPAML
ncbi:MAG TPA: hypothetical protein DER01_16875 [Phycisphaerales bacterium]|nr:hypothetical protein [Phycisphaerales bacterium]